MVWYLDTSAFLKLVALEDETPRLRAWFTSHEGFWSSQLLHTEAMRSAARLGLDAEVVEEVLEAVSLVLPSVTTFATTAHLQPWTLRSLGAVHLATAMEIGDHLEGIVVYDERLSEAARAASLVVVAPR